MATHDTPSLERLKSITRGITPDRQTAGKAAREAYQKEQSLENRLREVPYDSDKFDSIKNQLLDTQDVRFELQQLAQRATNANDIQQGTAANTEHDGLLNTLHCDEYTFVEPMLAVLKSLPETLHNDFNCAIGSGHHSDLTNTASKSVFNSKIHFSLTINTDEYAYTSWNKKARHLTVKANRSTQTYTCWGLLADPLETNNAAEMAAHVEQQLPAIRRRLNTLLELERVSGTNSRLPDNPTYNELKEHRHRSVIRASGIGDKTIKRLIEVFGAPSNIPMYGTDGIEKYASTAYGNDPDTQRALEQCKTAVQRFRRFTKTNDLQCSGTLDELADYPKAPVYTRSKYYTPHTDQTFDD